MKIDLEVDLIEEEPEEEISFSGFDIDFTEINFKFEISWKN